MVSVRTFELEIWVSFVLCLICFSFGFSPEDNYLIDCGSSTNTSVDNRVFVSDSSSSINLLTQENISAEISLSSISSNSNYSSLYHTARIFTGPSNYSFPIKQKGRLWIRLHFFPFVYEKYNMTLAKFSVSAQSFTLIKEYQSGNGSLVKEYSLNITSDKLVLTFTPLANSFAFLNAIEVFSLPPELIPEGATTIGSQTGNQNLQKQALETVARVNMGNETVTRQTDPLWRLWVADDSFLVHNGLAKFVSNVKAVNFTGEKTKEEIAPADVYGTATMLNSEPNPSTNANVTWIFDVDPGFEYLVRFHFCDISNTPQPILFNVYINSWYASHDFNLQKFTSKTIGAPYYMDSIIRVSDSRKLSVSVGPSAIVEGYPNAFLNGLEIMKVNNSRGSFDVLESNSNFSTDSKMKVGLIVGLAAGLFVVVVLVLVLFLLCRRRKKLAQIGHSKAEDKFGMNGGGATAIFSSSKIGYRYPFVAIQEATENFNESLVVGVGGFGKVYKGVLRDKTMVAVKRGGSQSHQGLAEFRTEIEMLSQFRHRHLVSLIGYCDEKDEMIIIYEYMENGTLKNHLYGSNFPSLSWRKRLEVCIGSARGLHYLHTGSTNTIIHRDVKSANILLDENFMAKVADFGLSKTGPDLDQTHVSTAVKGSFGYLDPEYLTRQQLTEKSDVYSFGVVMLEVLCGRPVIDPSLPREKMNLVEWAINCQKRGHLEDIVDPKIMDQIKPESLKKFGEIVEKCLAESGLDRPSMGDVLWNLEYAFQLQGNEEKSSPNGETSSQANLVNQSHSTISITDFSMGSVDDLAGVSMSKVFAQIVQEEARES
ncbi:probable receptor-like protein kinase At2g39360 [Pistacia vera]|uniref:probable receptor-like protein kinase At2g39360 n=1 Tax=Pistacia vera TaxID=55513 RepID=UPI001263820C|nr:probable receptor-like protein kinase At2g39360 [Pistacia vera]